MKNPSKSLEKRVLDWIRSNDLFSPGESVVCAFSGGADSVAMTLLLWRLRRELDIELSAAHVNHMLRGAEADRDEEFCRSFCAERGIPFTALRGDAAALARELGTGTEDAARELRYSLLSSLGTDRIAVAHNADDNLETVLMRLARGGGARGLSGIPPKNHRVVRPVMCLTRAEIEEVCREAGAEYVTDSTNHSDAYTRNLVRHRIVGELKNINPNVSALVLENSLRLREEDAWLDAEAARIMDENGGMTAELFERVSPVLARRMIRLSAERAGTAVDGGTVQKLLELSLSGQSRFYYDVPGARFFGEYGRLRFGKKEENAGFRYALSPGKTVDTGLWTVTMLPHREENKNIYRIFNIFTVSSDRIQGELVVRSAESGDRLRRNAKSGTKKLRRIYSDMKLSEAERSALPVLADDGGVIFVPGIGPAPSGRDPETGESFDIIFTKNI